MLFLKDCFPAKPSYLEPSPSYPFHSLLISPQFPGFLALCSSLIEGSVPSFLGSELWWRLSWVCLFFCLTCYGLLLQFSAGLWWRPAEKVERLEFLICLEENLSPKSLEPEHNLKHIPLADPVLGQCGPGSWPAVGLGSGPQFRSACLSWCLWPGTLKTFVKFVLFCLFLWC